MAAFVTPRACSVTVVLSATVKRSNGQGVQAGTLKSSSASLREKPAVCASRVTFVAISREMRSAPYFGSEVKALTASK